jgi:hypothetical protein
MEHGQGKEDSKHAQNRTSYKITTPHKRNYNRIRKVSKEQKNPSSCL